MVDSRKQKVEVIKKTKINFKNKETAWLCVDILNYLI